MEGVSLHKVKLDSTEKDILISQLKSEIMELQQTDRNYDILSKKYQRLKHE